MRSMISIHPMLRFNCDVCSKLSGILEFQYILCYGSTLVFKTRKRVRFFISIHPMLRFNPWIYSYTSAIEWISIHPMLRFNPKKESVCLVCKEFQYILCYGSTIYLVIFLLQYIDFNTSYVTVQRVQFLLIVLFVFYFNTSYVTVQHYAFNPNNKVAEVFQYILCYGSTGNIT